MLTIGNSVFCISRYGLGVPFWLLRVLRRAKTDTAKYNDPHFQALFGWMLRKYSGDRYYWEICVTMRKLAIASPSTFCRTLF